MKSTETTTEDNSQSQEQTFNSDDLQQALTNHYLNPYNHKDYHKIIVYSSEQSNNVLITYLPNHTYDDKDNTGKVEPVLPLLIKGTVKDNQLVSLSNWQMITGQQYMKNQYILFLNGNHNPIDNQKLNQLKANLKNKFNTKITKTGVLTLDCRQIKLTNAEKKKHLDINVKAFMTFINALQFIFINGSDYVVHNNAKKNLIAELTNEENAVSHASSILRADRAKHHHGTKKPKNKLPKAHGNVVKGFSSTDGTPRQIRYAKIRKKRAERKAYLKAHPEVAKKIKAEKEKKANEVHLNGAYVITVGKFSVSHAEIVKKLKAVGANYQNNCTKETQYMLCDKPSTTKKYLKAKKMGVRIINETQINK